MGNGCGISIGAGGSAMRYPLNDEDFAHDLAMLGVLSLFARILYSVWLTNLD